MPPKKFKEAREALKRGTTIPKGATKAQSDQARKNLRGMIGGAPKPSVSGAKPNLVWTLPRMKDYARKHGLRKRGVKLSVKKEEMRTQLKNIGHWDYQFDTHGKPAIMPRNAVSQLRDYRRRQGGGRQSQKLIDKEVIRRGGGGGNVPL